MQRNFLEIFSRLEDTRWAKEVPEGSSEESTTHQGAPGGPGMPKWVVPTSVASRTPCLPYYFPKIPETLGVNIDQMFRRRKAL